MIVPAAYMSPMDYACISRMSISAGHVRRGTVLCTDKEGGSRIAMNRNLQLYMIKYCEKHEVSPEEALTHAPVRAAAEYYAQVERQSRNIIRAQDGVSGGDADAT